MIVCGEGELVKTFLTANQAPIGSEIHEKPLTSVFFNSQPSPLNFLRDFALRLAACTMRHGKNYSIFVVR
ncbi:MAG: hypothetical protein DME32_01615 [Verrucomicrobia bacterium]|nr:MAG: hypothetical protein DME32_01615 [Verrucomicrobiota bacterium]